MATVIQQFGPMTKGSDADVEQALISWADRNVRTGVFDEAPFNTVEIACENRRAIITVTGNLPYFDGEADIMMSQCRGAAQNIASLVAN